MVYGFLVQLFLLLPDSECVYDFQIECAHFLFMLLFFSSSFHIPELALVFIIFFKRKYFGKRVGVVVGVDLF